MGNAPVKIDDEHETYDQETFVVPKRMKAVMLVKPVRTHSTNPDDYAGHLEVQEVDVPVPGKGQVLVRVERSPINPSDLSTITGTYNADTRKPLPAPVGNEGSGRIVAVGGGITTWGNLGKRVAVPTPRSGGVWGQYCVVDAVQALPLPDDISYEQGCSCYVNPLTVLGFVDIAKAAGVTTIVHTAAASALGKMLIRYATVEGMGVIAVVRRPEQAEEVTKLGAKVAIVTEGKEWESALKDACSEHDARVGFCAVAGSLSGKVLHAMPKKSTLYVYGGLSREHISGIPASDFIFAQKQLAGFWLTSWLKTKNLLQQAQLLREVSKHLGGALSTTVRISYPLEQIGQALADYNGNMGGGKVCLAPSRSPPAEEVAGAPAAAPAPPAEVEAPAAEAAAEEKVEVAE